MSDWQQERRRRDRAQREEVMSLPVLQIHRHGVLDGGDDGSRRRQHATLADALDAEGIERRRRFPMNDADAWHVRRRGEQIFGERRGQGLAGIVEDHALEERIAALRELTIVPSRS